MDTDLRGVSCNIMDKGSLKSLHRIQSYDITKKIGLVNMSH